MYRIFGGPKDIIKHITNNTGVICISRRHAMVAALAHQCVECEAVRNEVYLLKKEVAILITRMSKSRGDKFIRSCLIRCLNAIILVDSLSPEKIKDILESKVLCCLFDVIHDGSTKGTIKESICFSINAIIVHARNSNCSDIKRLLFLSIHQRGMLHIITKLIGLEEYPGIETSRLSAIKRLGISTLKACFEFAIDLPEALSLQLLKDIHQEELLSSLIIIHRKEEGFGRKQLSFLIIEVIEMMLREVRVGKPKLNSTISLIELIIKNARSQFISVQHHSPGQFDRECLLYFTITLFACDLVITNHKRVTSRNRTKSRCKKNSPFAREERSETIAMVIQVTWALVHKTKKIRKVAILAFRELFDDIANSILCDKDMNGLLQLGYVHILIVLRDLCRLKKMRSISFLISNAMCKAISAGQQAIHNSMLPPNRLLIEQLFLIHIEARRAGKQGMPPLMKTFINHKSPWENWEEVYNAAENIMRIYYLLIVLKSAGAASQPIYRTCVETCDYLDEKSMSNLDQINKLRNLQIEICSRDKSWPVVLRCPPIERIISNAPALAIKVRNLI